MFATFLTLSLIILYGDILRLTWDDAYDFERKSFRAELRLVEKKTGKPKSLALNSEASSALRLLSQQTAPELGAPLFRSRKTGRAIGRVQAYRIIRAAAEALALACRVSCHSLRKTFGYFAWKKGVSPAVIMEIYNHSDFAVTRRYLGVSQDDKNEVYAGMRFGV